MTQKPPPSSNPELDLHSTPPALRPNPSPAPASDALPAQAAATDKADTAPHASTKDHASTNQNATHIKRSDLGGSSERSTGALGRYFPENAEQAAEALAEGKPSLVWRKIVADTETPVGAAAKLMVAERGDFLLESVEGGEQRGRYSLLGLDPDLIFRADSEGAFINARWQTNRTAFEPAFEPVLASACSDEGAERANSQSTQSNLNAPNDANDPSVVNDPNSENDPSGVNDPNSANGSNSQKGSNNLKALRQLVAQCRIDVPQELPQALSCLVGYFGYETVTMVEDIPRCQESPLGLPDILFVRPTLTLIFDSLSDELFAIAPIWPDNSQSSPEQQISVAADRIDASLARLAQPVPAPPAYSDLTEIETHAILPDGKYAEMVDRAKSYIEAGDIFQVVLAQRFTCDFPLPPLNLYRALRRINPSPFLFFLDLPGFAVVGSSPEILVRVRDGHVTIRPIAGTRPRGADQAADLAAEQSLLTDPKERAEHLMLLDLGRNDVGRIAEAGSVNVTSSFGVERYSHVMHIVSNVEGKVAPEHDALDALFAGFPAGTVSGAPKIRACQIIAELEGETRGAYAGGVGYFAPDGSLDSCIVLRTGVVKDGVLHVQAGAGIVADSNSDYEQRECEAKASALIAAAKEAVNIATQPGFGQ